MLDHIHRFIIPASMSLLPEKMDTPAARAMLLAIGLQESRFERRLQIGGPARGFWQFERGGGVSGTLLHHASRDHARIVCDTLKYEPTVTIVYDAVADNDVLACCFARLLLWTHPKALPGPSAPDKGWAQYKDTWRPGKPHRETWDELYAQAWATIKGE